MNQIKNESLSCSVAHTCLIDVNMIIMLNYRLFLGESVSARECVYQGMYTQLRYAELVKTIFRFKTVKIF